MSPTFWEKSDSQDTRASDAFPSQELPGQITDSPPASPTSFRASSLNPDTIPKHHRRRTLILCFDGTGDKFDADNSNVVQFVSMLKRDDRREQMVYYQSGIGTYTSQSSPSFWTALTNAVSKGLDEAVAWNLGSHIKSGYRFLMENYQVSDAICIFGFSRGAYTARSLAGMLTKVGLLPPGNEEQIQFAYDMYTREDEVGWHQSCEFKKTFSVDVEVEFLGVWDTVNSVGIVPQRLPFTVSNTSIRYFRHAVSLDERRAKFKANLWPPEKMEERFTNMLAANRRKHKDKEHTLMQLEKEFSDTTRPTSIYEVWFAGCHCDVGGGSVSNTTRHSLARIPLRWMIRQCFLTNTGIMFQGERLRTIGLDPATLYPKVKHRPEEVTIEKLDKTRFASDASGELTLVNPRTVLTEEEEDLADALCPIYDQLSLSKVWWILEVLPMKQRIQSPNGTWKWKLTSNMGKARYFPQGEGPYPIHIHRTVKIRMETELEGKLGENYTPRASPLRSEPIWVD